jgi:hypothetical protein
LCGVHTAAAVAGGGAHAAAGAAALTMQLQWICSNSGRTHGHITWGIWCGIRDCSRVQAGGMPLTCWLCCAWAGCLQGSCCPTLMMLSFGGAPGEASDAAAAARSLLQLFTGRQPGAHCICAVSRGAVQLCVQCRQANRAVGIARAACLAWAWSSSWSPS